MTRFASIICLLMLSLVVSFAKPGETNDSPLAARVTLTFDNTPLNEALRRLLQQIDLQIVYDDRLAAESSVTGAYENQTIAEVLEHLLAQTGLSLKVLPENIIIITRPEKTEVTISGNVYDAETRLPLPDANLLLIGRNKGTASDSAGWFYLSNVPAGKCSLTVSYIGYHGVTSSLLANEDIRNLSIQLYRSAVPLDSIRVIAQKQSMELGKQPGAMTVDPKDILLLPGTGERDILRPLGLLPGIRSGAESGSGLYIRGGTPDENLVLYDGMTIYNANHFYGFVSAFNSEAVQGVQVFKSAFPSKFGGRTSGVVAVQGRTANFNLMSMSARLNLLSASASFQAPVFERGGLLVAMRRSYTDLIQSGLYNEIFNSVSARHPPGQPQFRHRDGNPSAGGIDNSRITPDFFYYDLTAKLTYLASNQDLLSATLFKSGDESDATQAIAPRLNNRPNNPMAGDSTTVQDLTQWGNLGINASWSRFWSDAFSSEFSAVYSSYRSENATTVEGEPDTLTGGNRDPKYLRDFSDNNEIKDASLRWHNTLILRFGHQLDFGISQSRTTISANFNQNEIRTPLVRQNHADQTALYLQDDWQLTNSILATFGMRATYYRPTSHTYWEPRTSLVFSIGQALSLKGGWSRHYQFINRAANHDVLQQTRDIWVLADERNQPGFAEHRSVGLRYESSGAILDVEAYHKDLDNLNRFVLRPDAGPEANLQPGLIMGTGVSKGVEFLLQRTLGQLTGWLTYSISSVRYTFPEINAGETFAADQDRRHQVKLAGIYKSGKWTFSTTWTFASGAPYTELDDWIAGNGYNSARLPATHQLDVSLIRSFVSRRFSWDIGISILNLYDHTNILSRDYVVNTNPVIIRDLTSIGFTPTLTLGVQFK